MLARVCAVVCAIAVCAFAQCDDFPGCDFLSPQPGIFDEAGVDPNDGSRLGIFGGVCPCVAGEAYGCLVTYTGVDGGTTTETSSTVFDFSSSEAFFTFSYTGTNTAIAPGSPVSLQYQLNGGNYPPVEFTSSPVTSIYYTDATSTVTTTTSAVTTTTSSATVTSTTTISQATSTSPCTTGTATVTASNTRTITATSTITSPPKTKKILRVVITNTRASCIPNPRSSSRPSGRIQAREEALVERQQVVNQGIVETPYYPNGNGPPESTTYTTDTVLTTTTATTTDTSTNLQTATVTNTIMPTPLTTTVCSNVRASRTITPTVISTVVTKPPQSTTTVTQTYGFTFTFYPLFPKLCTPPPPKPHQTTAPPGAKKSCIPPPRHH
ncbi:MAG: hypothetical protein Q9159_007287 [Coniocarpon cinnabarinum]